ncbi:MAG: hypothetical protein H6577_28315 [Lewinellaceae bacterium]|nr:hypothetical protein [Saprospiraceae bacterium]MCB9342052.1 hypothetical protein [Lewinellaceae bacterium]
MKMKNTLLLLSFLFASVSVFSQTSFLSISATSANKAEGNTGTTAFTFIVIRDGDISGFSSADWAVTGSGGNPANAADFGGTLPSGTVNFAPIQTTQNITVNVTGDTDVEPDEGFTVTLSNPTNAIITTATATGTILNDDMATGYCAAGATETCCEKISNIEFNTINNPSSSTAGYEDFTSVSTTVDQGSTHTFTGTITGGAFSDEMIVWIDFNQDMDFEDPGEEVFNSPTGAGPTYSGDITIPATAMTGSTRMRVRLHSTISGENPNDTPCGDSGYGQVEDYTINITTSATPAVTLDFDGTDDHVVLPANLTASLTDFTFEAWVYWDGSTNWQRIMDFGENTNVYMYLTPKGFPGDNPIFAITTSSSAGEQRINSSVAATVGQWQHYAVVLDAAANTGTLYIDGTQVGQNTNLTLSPSDLGNLANNYLGKAQFFFDPYLDGKLDEVRIWNFAKTASQVNCQKDFELLGTEPGLVAYYNFNQGIAGGNNAGVTTLDDLTTNNNDGTLTDFALTGAGSNWVEPGAPVSGTSSSCCPSGNVLYVNDNASGANDGTSWTDAYNDLQDALTEASNCANITQIWVAAGTYKPTSGTDRTISFAMQNDLAVYGGFDGTETMLGERDWVANVTTLSGDIGTTGDNSDNSYHVISNDNNGLNGTALLDGFTVTAGKADGFPLNGGGMYNDNSSPTVTNCSFSGNEAGSNGGGMSNNNSSPTMTSCSFSGNEAGLYGGGMQNNNNSSPTVTNCSFSGNEAGFNGGGMHNDNSSPTVINCSFSGNSTNNRGGGMYNVSSSSPTVINCSFSGNSTNLPGGGMVNDSQCSPTVTNCIFWGNSTEIANFASTPTVTYSIVQGGYTGTGNLDVDPLFVSQPPIGLGTTGDLHLQDCSPAKDVGTATGAPATDFDGDARPQGPGFDMGFDESTTSCCPPGNIVFVDADATGGNNGTSWSDAYTDLQDALAEADNCSNITQIWVAAGTYRPTSSTDRTISFAMQNDVAIYGGFAGTETMLGERDWVANVTTLSGDIGTPGDNTDNSNHVISNNGLNSTAVLDGFTVSGGNADEASGFPFFLGGGMYNVSSSPTVANCSFSGNSANAGGGMYNNNNSSPTVTSCSFSGNYADNGGGGMRNFNSSNPTVINTSFSGNYADTLGGAMYNVNSSPILTNSSFSGNGAGIGGGGMYNFDASPTVTNCILWGNSTAFENINASNPTVTYSIVQGGYAGTGNLDVDPLFVSQPPIGLGTTGDLHLQACSPAKDAGTATGAPATDFDGDARPQGPGFDMGFDESTTSCCPNLVTLNGNIPTGTYQAAVEVQADGTVQNGSQVILKAGTSFTLQNGFTVELGGTLETIIEVCD